MCRRSSVSSRSVSPKIASRSLSPSSVVKSPSSQSLSGSPPSSPTPDTKLPKVYQKASNVREVLCPICDKCFANLQNVRKHMRVVHKLPNEEINERLKGQSSTAKKCPHCLQYNTRIDRHLKVCKRKPKTKVGRKRKIEEEVCDLLGAFKAYDARNPRRLTMETRKKHLRYAEMILSEMDLNEKGFNSEKLVSSDPPFLPDIIDLLEGKTPSMRSIFASAYQYLISFLKDFHRKTKNVSAFLGHLTNLRSDITHMFGVFNKEIAVTRLENRNKREGNPAILTYNLPRAAEVLKTVKASEGIRSFVTSVAEGRLKELQDSGWDKLGMTNLLAALCMMFAVGARPSVTAFMTIREFEEAAQSPKGYVVNVHRHKTAKRMGPASLTFLYPRLYEACDNYRKAFCSNLPKDSPLFLNSNDGELRPNTAIRAIIPFVDFSTEEKKFLNVEWMRKLWSNWNWMQADDTVRNAGRKLMGHSEETFNKYYLIKSRTEALDHGKLLLDDILNSGKGGSESEDEEPEMKRRKVGTSKGRNTEDSECQAIGLRKCRTEQEQEQETKKSAHTFTTREREKMRELFEKEGEKRTTLSGKEIEEMAQKDIEFSDILGRLYESKSKLKGSVKEKVHAAIRTCVTRRKN